MWMWIWIWIVCIILNSIVVAVITVRYKARMCQAIKLIEQLMGLLKEVSQHLENANPEWKEIREEMRKSIIPEKHNTFQKPLFAQVQEYYNVFASAAYSFRSVPTDTPPLAPYTQAINEVVTDITSMITKMEGALSEEPATKIHIKTMKELDK